MSEKMPLGGYYADNGSVEKKRGQATQEKFSITKIELDDKVVEVKKKLITFSEKVRRETGGVDGYDKFTIPVSSDSMSDGVFKDVVAKLELETDLESHDNSFHYVSGVYGRPKGHAQLKELFIKGRGLLEKPFDPQAHLIFKDEVIAQQASLRELSLYKRGAAYVGYRLYDLDGRARSVEDLCKKLCPEKNLEPLFASYGSSGRNDLSLGTSYKLQSWCFERGGAEDLHAAQEEIVRFINDHVLGYHTYDDYAGMYVTNRFALRPAGGLSSRNKYKNSMVIFNGNNPSYVEYLKSVSDFANIAKPLQAQTHFDFINGDRGIDFNLFGIMNPEFSDNNKLIPIMFMPGGPSLRWCSADIIYRPGENEIEVIKMRS